MGRKKKKKVVKEKAVVWCFYCDREFGRESTLIEHQQSKHFKCKICYKHMSTATGLLVHMENVHKEACNVVHNALPDRQSIDFEIYGMMGIPQKFLNQRAGPSAKKQKLAGAPAPAPPAMPAAPYGSIPAAAPMARPGHMAAWHGHAGGASIPKLPVQYGAPPPAAWGAPQPPQRMPQQNYMWQPTNPMYAARPPQMQQPQMQQLRGPPANPGAGWRPAVGVPPPPPVPVHQGPSVVLLFDEKSVSMEEKRAGLAKYKVSADVTMDKLSKIDQGIGDRLKAAMQSIGQ